MHKFFMIFVLCSLVFCAHANNGAEKPTNGQMMYGGPKQEPTPTAMTPGNWNNDKSLEEAPTAPIMPEFAAITEKCCFVAAALEGQIIDEHLARAVAQPHAGHAEHVLTPIVHHHVFSTHNQELPIEHHFIYHAPPTSDHDYRFHQHRSADLTHTTDYHRELYQPLRQDPAQRYSTTSTNLSHHRLAVPKSQPPQSSSSSSNSSCHRSQRSGSSSRHNRSQGHDEIDQAQVDEQVARNVSNILSASLSLQAAAAAAAAAGQSCSTVGATAGGASVGVKRQHICGDCQRAVSSQRNLVRHRQSCKAAMANAGRRLGDQGSRLPPSHSGTSGPECDDELMESAVARLSSQDELDLISPEGLDTRMLEAIGMPINDDDRLSRSPSPSPLSDDHCIDGRRQSSSSTLLALPQAIANSNTASGNSNAPRYVCEACSRIVSSMRSLKRHRGTCKPYALWETTNQEKNTTVASPLAASGPVSAAPPLPPPSGAPAPPPPSNVCEHCNRQLCSSSNLKRHLATCKAVMTAAQTKTDGRDDEHKKHTVRPLATTPVTANASTANAAAGAAVPAMGDRERSILDRSFAAALAASGGAAAVDGLRPTTRRSSSDTLSIPSSQDYVSIPYGEESNNYASAPNPEICPLRQQIDKENAIRLHTIQPSDGLVCVSSGTAPPMTPTILTFSGAASVSSGVTETRYECPECNKTYSCKKNVKRHRMGVHKLDGDALSRAAEVRTITVSSSSSAIVGGGAEQQSPAASSSQISPLNRFDDSSPTEALGMRDHYNCRSCSTSFWSRRMLERHRREECPAAGSSTASGDSTLVARNEDAAAAHAVEMAAKREHEATELDNCEVDSTKKSVAELAEADTTFNEDNDDYISRSNVPSVVDHLPLTAPLQMHMPLPPRPQLPHGHHHHHHLPPAALHGVTSHSLASPAVALPSYVSSPPLSGGGFSSALPPISTCQGPMPARPYQVQPLPPPPQYIPTTTAPLASAGSQHYPQVSRQLLATPGNAPLHLSAAAAPLHQQQRFSFPQAVTSPASTHLPGLHRGGTQAIAVQPQAMRPPPPPPKKQHTCMECNRTLSSDYSLKRHRNTCPEAKAAEAKEKGKSEKNNTDEQFGGKNANSSSDKLTPAFQPLPGITVSPSSQPSSLPSANMMATATTTRIRQFSGGGTTIHIIDNQTMGMTKMGDNNSFGKVDSSTNGTSSTTMIEQMRQEEQDDASTAITSADPDSTTTHRENSESSQCSPTALCSPGSSSSIPPTPATAMIGMKREHSSASDEGAVYQQMMPSQLHNSNSGKAKHQCQDCGKFYSSEWNLERHRRESCPMRTKKARISGGNSTTIQHSDLKESPHVRDEFWVDDLVLIVGETRLNLCRSVVSAASQYFNQLFRYYEANTEVPLPVQVDPVALQHLIAVLQGKQQLNDKIIDAVIFLADRLKFKGFFDKCVEYIAERLPHVSVMHAIRLAEQYRLADTKHKLFESISIDVFRSLAADEDYRQMGAELKAELLEKWGTFL